MVKSILTGSILIACTSLFISASLGNYLNRPRNEDISSLTPQYLGGGSISGRIVDSKGYPVVGERVYAVSEKYGDAKQPGSYSVRQASVLTDNQGNYRIQGMAPGNYIVSIGPSPGGEVNSQPSKRAYYVKRYYPNTYSKDNAKVIEVNEGSELTGINITAGEMKNTVEIRGRVVKADTGQPIAGLTISYGVVPRSGATSVGAGAVVGGVVIASTIYSSSDMPSRDKSNENGEFLITGVIPGKYYITLDRQRNQDTEYYAEPTESDVTDNGVSDVIVKMRRGITISGKVDIQGTNDPEILSRVKELRISAISRPTQFNSFLPDGNRNATISSDGAFTLKGIRPGKVSISLNSSSRDGGVFQLDRIEYKGVSIGREGIEVGAGENLTNVRLVAVYGAITVRGYVKINGKLPEDIKLRLVVSRQGDTPPLSKFTDIDAQGHFVITNLSAGVYSFRLLPLMLRTFGENRKIISEAIHRAEQKIVVSEDNQQPIVLTVDLN
jgi:Carboxypeptidase regulatory-like domain